MEWETTLNFLAAWPDCSLREATNPATKASNSGVEPWVTSEVPPHGRGNFFVVVSVLSF